MPSHLVALGCPPQTARAKGAGTPCQPAPPNLPTCMCAGDTKADGGDAITVVARTANISWRRFYLRELRGNFFFFCGNFALLLFLREFWREPGKQLQPAVQEAAYGAVA